MQPANVAAHIAAFEDSLRFNGEAVTFNAPSNKAGAQVACLVNRSKNRPAWKPGANTDSPGGVTVWFRASLPTPKRGEVFTDSYNTEHRIEKVNFIAHAWECECASN